MGAIYDCGQTNGVSHGHIFVNGKKVNVPGYILQAGDTVEITDRGARTGNYLQAKARPRLSTVPAFLNVEKVAKKEKAKVIASPLSDDIPFEFEKRLVTEYYWKVK